MGCACEDGSRNAFIGRIKRVMDKKMILSFLKENRAKPPGSCPVVSGDMLEVLEKTLEGRFVVEIETEPEEVGDGTRITGNVVMRSDLFPQSLEWARERIGKPLRFTITTLPKKGPTCVDVAEIYEN